VAVERTTQRGAATSGVLATLMIVAGVAGCGASSDGADAPADTSVRGSITITSSAFADGARIPEEFTCRGEGTSPPLSWTGLPSGTRSVAIVVLDPDAPSGTFVHWVLVGVPAGSSELAAGTVPQDTTQARNSTGEVGWTPPCPPSGTHHYRFTVYALGGTVDVADGADPDTAIRAVQDAATAEGTLTGLVSAD
jgi:Raf kinase inhibitor-like YbhB/YbcL family protein